MGNQKIPSRHVWMDATQVSLKWEEGNLHGDRQPGGHDNPACMATQDVTMEHHSLKWSGCCLNCPG